MERKGQGQEQWPQKTPKLFLFYYLKNGLVPRSVDQNKGKVGTTSVVKVRVLASNSPIQGSKLTNKMTRRNQHLGGH